jgi:UDP-N-acetyl-D-mannosaminuronic acid transferase (WecB/TagA/CpsF family)
MQDHRLEWLWRLVRQPWRARRQWALVEFTWWVWQEQRRRRQNQPDKKLAVSRKH